MKAWIFQPGRHIRLDGHSIHQFASRLAAIGMEKFPELSSYGETMSQTV